MSRRFVSERTRASSRCSGAASSSRFPRSSFYEWSRRPLSQHYLDDIDLAAAVFEIHDASRRTYGAPRVAGQLHDRGRQHGTKGIARLMAECGLVDVHGRRNWRRGTRPTAPAGDLLERDFTAERSDEWRSRTSPSSNAATASSASPGSRTSTPGRRLAAGFGSRPSTSARHPRSGRRGRGHCLRSSLVLSRSSRPTADFNSLASWARRGSGYWSARDSIRSASPSARALSLCWVA